MTDKLARSDGFHAVARADDIREGELLAVEVEGRPLVLGRVGGVIYAVSGLCPHQDATLADGDLDGRILTCPAHNGAVDITTGEPCRLPVRTPVPRYAVRVHDGVVLVSRQPLPTPGGAPAEALVR